jgi:hypothetical protein
VSVYLKRTSVADPGRIVGVQFGFGQPTGAPLKLTCRAGTFNCPFFVEGTMAELVGEKVHLVSAYAIVSAGL